MLFDAQSRQIHFVSDGAEELFGLSRSQLLGRRLPALLPQFADLRPRHFRTGINRGYGDILEVDVYIDSVSGAVPEALKYGIVTIELAQIDDAATEHVVAPASDLNERLLRQLMRSDATESALIANMLCEGVVRLGLERAALSEVEGSWLIDRHVVPHPSETRKWQVSQSIAALRQGDARTFENLDTTQGDPANQWISQANVGTFIAARFSVSGHEWFIAFWSTQPRHAPFTFDDAQVVEFLADYAAWVIERSEKVENLTHVVHTDQLTGLKNRAGFIKELEGLLVRATRREECFGLLLLNLKTFEIINDIMGYMMGDRVLIEVGRRLQDAVPGAPIIARLGGDEFAAILQARNAEEVCQLADRVASVMRKPLYLEAPALEVTAKIGVAQYPGDGVTSQTLMLRADAALQRARRQAGSQIVHYSEGVGLELQARRAVTSGLGVSSITGQFILCYQPIVHPVTSNLVGVEALLRWMHPTLGLLSPAVFLETAQLSNLSTSIDVWVVRTALEQLANWLQLGHRFGLSVNLSSFDDAVFEHISGLLLRTGVDPSLFSIEVREAIFVRDAERWARFFERCRSLGVHCGLDGFACGESSLRMLATLPAEFAKLDNGLIANLLQDRTALFVVEAAVRIVSSFGWNLMAEGVETAEQRRWLAARGATGLQGFAIAHPMTALDFRGWLNVNVLDGRRKSSAS